MDRIRECLVYKDVPITICFRELTPIEHYETIRLLLATRTKDVCICTHESTSTHVEKILKTLPIKFIRCYDEF